MTIDPSVLAVLTMPATTPQAGTSVLLISTPPAMPLKISGEVVNVDRSGQVVIQTDAGEVVIKTDLPLTVGQKVDIKLPPPQLNAPPIATLIPQNTSAAAAPRPDTTVAQSHPAVVMDLTAPEEFSTFTAASAAPMPAAVSYTPVSSIPPAQTLFQLIGLPLPATMIPAPNAQTGATSPNALWPQANNPGLPGAALPTGAAPGTATQTMPLDRVQILFMGPLEEAKAQLDEWVKQNSGVGGKPMMMSSENAFFSPASGKIAAPLSTPAMTAMNTSFMQQARMPSFPLIAQLTGLTPQKLPIFEVMPQQSFATSSSTPTEQGIAEKAQIIVHAPVLMTGAEQQQHTGLSSVLLVRMPAVPVPPEAVFATQSLADEAPLLMQILQDPGGFVPPEMMAAAGGLRDVMPKPSAPQFAMQIIASILGFSKADPAAAIGQKLAQALKPEQAEQLGKELQRLNGLVREGAPQAEGLRFNFPVEMAGQYYLWQMTLRPPDYDRSSSQSSFTGEKPARFILDLYMSRLGPMQVDGLSYAKTRKLDLILRTKTALPEPAKDTLLVQAMSVFDQADLKGSIAFQTY